MIVKLYNDNPNVREVRRIGDMLRNGGIAVLPTDTLYCFACSMEHKKAAEQIAQLKGYKLKQAKYSMLCESLSQASEYVRAMDKETFALLKSALPGPFTFIMEASGSVPRNYQNPNKTIGIRVPENDIARAIIAEVGCPLICTSVRPLGGDDEPENYTDPDLIHDRFGSRVDIVVDGGIADADPSTVIDCSDGIQLVRQGKGRVETGS
ncbi:MAG: threonylcarbamoyl-AMP synthase [Bacteroidales bacterium]|nr:threonylcarbamoyl-AMP synthase [Bacteroidales bacterium]